MVFLIFHFGSKQTKEVGNEFSHFHESKYALNEELIVALFIEEPKVDNTITLYCA